MIGKKVKFYYEGTKSYLTGVIEGEGCFVNSFSVNLGNLYIMCCGFVENTIVVSKQDLEFID